MLDFADKRGGRRVDRTLQFSQGIVGVFAQAWEWERDQRGEMEMGNVFFIARCDLISRKEPKWPVCAPPETHASACCCRKNNRENRVMAEVWLLSWPWQHRNTAKQILQNYKWDQIVFIKQRLFIKHARSINFMSCNAININRIGVIIFIIYLFIMHLWQYIHLFIKYIILLQIFF